MQRVTTEKLLDLRVIEKRSEWIPSTSPKRRRSKSPNENVHLSNSPLRCPLPAFNLSLITPSSSVLTASKSLRKHELANSYHEGYKQKIRDFEMLPKHWKQ